MLIDFSNLSQTQWNKNNEYNYMIYNTNPFQEIIFLNKKVIPAFASIPTPKYTIYNLFGKKTTLFINLFFVAQ